MSRDLEENGITKWDDGAAEVKFTLSGNKWRVVTIYSQNIEETQRKLEDNIREEEEGHLIIGGDWNARTGDEGGPVRGEIEEREEEEGTRNSKDKLINAEGRKMLEGLRGKEWMILNGAYGKEGSWTYIGGRGASVIDYVVVNGNAEKEVTEVTEGNRTESDHLPMEVRIKGRKGREK